MRLKKVSLENFKCHGSLSVDVGMGVEIVGPNGSGKTSVLEAITSALYGRDLYGGTGISRFVGEGESPALVSVELGGLNVKRQISSTSVLYLDDEQVKVVDILSELPPIDVGMAMMNPMVWVFNSDADKRKIFMSLLPKPNRRELFIEKYGSELADRFLKTNKAEVNSLYSSVRTEILMTENRLQTARLRVKEAKSKLKTMKEPINEEDLTKEYQEAVEKLAKLTAQKERREELTAQLNKLETEAVVFKREIDMTGLSLLETVEKLKERGEEIKATLKRVGDKKNELKARVDSAQIIRETGECPVCHTPIGSIDLGSTSEQYEKAVAISNKLSGEWEGISESLRRAVATVERAKELKGEIDTLPADETVLATLENRVNRLKLKVADRGGVEEAMERGAVENTLEHYGKALEEDEKRLERLEKERDNLEVLKNAFGSKGVESLVAKSQSTILEGYFKGYFDEVRIKTVRPNKTTDGVKEVFDLFIDGVEFKNHSFGERLLIGVAMSLIVRELSKKRFDFMLLDEVSILSKETRKKIAEWTSNISLISTDVGDKFSIVENGNLGIKATK